VEALERRIAIKICEAYRREPVEGDAQLGHFDPLSLCLVVLVLLYSFGQAKIICSVTGLHAAPSRSVLIGALISLAALRFLWVVPGSSNTSITRNSDGRCAEPGVTGASIIALIATAR